MSKACENILNISPQDLGFNTDADVQRFAKIIIDYSNAIKKDPTKHGILKSIGENALSKLQTDLSTSLRASSFLKSTYRRLQENIPDISKDLMVKGLFFVDRPFDNIFERLGEGSKLREVVSYLKGVSPTRIKDRYAKRLTEDGGLGSVKATLLQFYPEKIRSNKLDTPYFKEAEVNAEGVVVTPEVRFETLQDGFVHSVFDTFKEVDTLINPNKTGEYKAHSFDKFKAIADKWTADKDFSEADADIISSLLAGYYHQLNSSLVILQELGVKVEWKADYMLPTFHDKQNMLLKAINRLKDDKGILDGSPDNAKKLRDLAVKLQADELIKHIHIGKLFEKKALKIPLDATAEDIYKLAYERVRKGSESIIDSHLIGQIAHELSDTETLALNLSSMSKKFSQRTFDFKSASDWIEYHEANNLRYSSKNNSGIPIMDMLLADANNMSKDFAILELLGTNPTLTLRKFNPIQGSLEKNTTQDRLFISEKLMGKEDRTSIKQMFFPVNETMAIDLPREEIALYKKDILRLGLSDTDLGQALLKNVNQSLYMTNVLKQVAIDLTKSKFKAALHIPNLLQDGFNITMKYAELSGRVMSVKDSFNIITTMVANGFSHLNGKGFNIKKAKELVKGLGGVSDEDLNYNSYAAVLEDLEVVTEVLQQEDAVYSHEVQKYAQSMVDKTFNKITHNPLAKAYGLGVGNMNRVLTSQQLVSSVLASRIIKETVKKFDKNFQDIPISLRERMLSYGLNKPRFIYLINNFNLTEGKNTFSSTRMMKDFTPLDFKAYSSYHRNAEKDFFNEYSEFLNKDYQAYNQYINGLGEKIDNIYKEYKSKATEIRKEDPSRFTKEELNEEIAKINSSFKKDRQELVDKTLEASNFSKEDLEVLTNLQEYKSLTAGNPSLASNTRLNYASVEEFYEANKSILETKTKRYKNEWALGQQKQIINQFDNFYSSLIDYMKTLEIDNSKALNLNKELGIGYQIAHDTFLFLKKFLIMSTMQDIEVGRRIAQKGGGGELAQFLANRALYYSASGLVYSTIIGVLSNEKRGFAAIADTAGDENLSVEQKTALILGNLTQAAFVGVPIGGVISTIMYTSGYGGSTIEALSNVVLSPIVTSLAGNADYLIKRPVKHLEKTLQSDSMTNAEQEAYAKYTADTIEKGVKQLPFSNLPVFRLLMEYKGLEWMESLLSLSREEQIEEIEQAREEIGEKGLLDYIRDPFFGGTSLPVIE